MNNLIDQMSSVKESVDRIGRNLGSISDLKNMDGLVEALKHLKEDTASRLWCSTTKPFFENSKGSRLYSVSFSKRQGHSA